MKEVGSSAHLGVSRETEHRVALGPVKPTWTTELANTFHVEQTFCRRVIHGALASISRETSFRGYCHRILFHVKQGF